MKVLFCGLGSIGTRHLRNLSAVCAERGIPLEAHALRASARALPEDVQGLLAGEMRALPPDETWDAVFITGPTHLHAQAIAALDGRAGAFFIEKPIFESTGYDLASLGLTAGQKAYVAAPMRYCGAYAKTKELLAGKPVYSVRAICSSYLPGWRPDADYTTVYSAKSAMGGGVALDLIHEWDYLTDLFGFPLSSQVYRGKFSHLDIDSDDLAVYIAQYNNFLCELHLDYFGRKYQRKIEVFLESGCLVTDFYTGIVTDENGIAHDCSEDVNARYLREMAYFLSYMEGSAPESVNSPRHALDVLKIALGEGK